MTSTLRWRALQWFADHEADVNLVLGRRQPSARMRWMMWENGQLQFEQTGTFGQRHWSLTAAGRALLASKRKHKTVRRKLKLAQDLAEEIPR